MSFIKHVLANKLPDIGEVEVFLFEHCNLRCVHCFQDHNATTGMGREAILAKADEIGAFLARNGLSEYILNVMGGELFQDHLLEKYLPIYSEFIEQVERHAARLNKKITFNFVTNLLCGDQKLKDWLELHDLKVSTSYDPTGRFNPEQLKTFLQNIDAFSDRISMVTGVITKPNIDKVMSGDVIFSELYDRFPFYWDQLTPGPTVPVMLMPKQSELLTFLKFLVDRYPRCLNVVSFIERKERPISCPSMNKLLIEPAHVSEGCRIKKQAEHQVIFISPVRESNEHLIENFMAQHNCLSCEYFKHCTFSCFVRHDWKTLVHDVPGCVYKAVFQHAAELT